MEDKTEKRIIFLSEFVEQKLRKEKELRFYQKELDALKIRMGFIRQEIDLTNIIINIIKKENVIDIEEELNKKIVDNDK